ncbi:lipid-A-disaccharide synthase [Helicobacter sp. 11S02629-2]|uniref:lipid-A-disaccharide synthase n=1 Tax=Helicobacter sp. 11S02629-2 TaxID=1476195 RepID=UPI000BA60263|nr:lipid-A-disaccharide synthase [Helicobacter sp. 11S02629-2]PAF45837.1 lipid-A-disaccharide synthase [Helicobacter sp. 11S02629-2]
MKIFVSALEPSSNLHLRNLKAKLLELDSSVEFIGVCDSDLGQSLFKVSEFSIMGFSDVFKRLKFLKQAMDVLAKEALKCDKILMLDSSSFHMRLAKKILSIKPDAKIMYYILPQLWAWKPWRARELLKNFTKLAYILPFEGSFYDYSPKARFVGHPLLDIKDYNSKEGFANLESNVFVFMPGSRKSEIKAHMGVFKEVALRLKERHSNAELRLILPAKFISQDVSTLYGDIDIFTKFYDTASGLKGASFCVVCSGTATLECALMQIPFLLVYKTKWLDYFIIRSLVNIKYAGLANIFYQALLGEAPGRGKSVLHDEIVQFGFNATNILQKIDSFDYKRYFEGVALLKDYLKEGSSKNVATWLLED